MSHACVARWLRLGLSDTQRHVIRAAGMMLCWVHLQAVIIGGGYIGMEISASLANNGVKATIVFPEPFLLSR